jgi:type I restriction enzyme, S subunit
LSDWSDVKLGQVAEFINGDRGKNYPSEGDFVDKGIPFINAGHLTDGEVDFSGMNYISESRYHLLGSGKTRQNDILYCLRGSLGKTAIVRHEGDAAIASSLVIIRPSDDCNAGYLYHFLTSALGRSEVSKFDNGSSQPNLSANSVKNYHLPLPPLPEQRRIAEVLDRAEALRAKRRAALAQLDSLTQFLFLDLFGDPATNPKQFPTPQLADAIELRGGFAFKSGDYVPDGIPLVRIGEVNRGGVTRESACFLPMTHEAAHARFIVHPGDMLMSLTGTTGKEDYGNVILLNDTFSCYFLNQRVALIEPKPSVLEKHYLLHVFRNPKIRARLTIKSRGIRQANISNGDVLELQPPVPPIELQREFARRVSAVAKLKTTQRASLAELDALFASLQHRAFRGEL